MAVAPVLPYVRPLCGGIAYVKKFRTIIPRWVHKIFAFVGNVASKVHEYAKWLNVSYLTYKGL